MEEVEHTALDDEDHAFIQRTVRRMVKCRLPATVRRFGESERVVCYFGGTVAWAAGTVARLNQDDVDEPGRQFPYLVKIDPPNSRLVCVPKDEDAMVRAEVCFGQRANALSFTLFCKPRKQSDLRRFSLGDRVACLVEGDQAECVAWAAGTVVNVNYDAGPDAAMVSPDWDWPCADGIVPYRVMLDTGRYVLVHRDIYWLVRDLTLQPAGTCQSEEGTRNRMSRFTRRRASDARLWTPQRTYFFPRPFQALALATLTSAYRLRTQPPPGVKASLGDLPHELLLDIIARAAGREQIDHMTLRIRVQSVFDESDHE